ncbi:hypothetical protein JX265_011331 [Neoarthrinium moseri]|uniref:DUF7492 domain-containing protein n=1 Tax=Neoarthrinium moseri TaxID=1658444 RepID=A0A9Q0AJL0_9PEZI|nr:hypothetical protein JX265_011331 [Neoarthrinium moseri]
MSLTRVIKALAILSATQSVNAHSWVEYVRRVSSTGSFVGDIGYPMGHVNRTDPSFADTAVQNKILDVTSNPAVCREFSGGGYSNPAYPPLTAAAGEFVSLQYAENGHTSFPDQTPRGFRGGNVMIYGTSEDTTGMGINDVLYQWDTEGSGGNQKGKLLASHFFDDGQCYENPNASPIRAQRAAKYGAESLLCQSNLQLPSDLPASGKYTVMWVWDWPQNPNEKGNTTEIYTSCAIINLDAPSSGSSIKGVVQFKQNKNILLAAIESQMKTLVEVTARGTGTAAPAAVTDAPAATNTASASASKTQASSSSKKHGGGGVKTVTVTAEAATVTQYETVTVSAGAGGSGQKTSSAAQASVTSGLKTSVRSSSTRPAITGAVSVTSVAPFLKARATGQARRMR